MKKVFLILGLCLLSLYLVFSAFYLAKKSKDSTCQGLEITIINDSYGASFVDAKDIEKAISTKQLDPVGKQLKDINTNRLEEEILKNHIVKNAHAYITDNGNVKIKIYQRKPILRVISNGGENYYIDSEGEKMSLSRHTVAYVPIATGTIKDSFAQGDLYKFALFLSDNPFWDAQIEQILVDNNEVRLIPRVGDQEIILGGLSNFEEKLEKLLAFYRNGQNKIGWNKYSVINLKYDKQVVGTKR